VRVLTQISRPSKVAASSLSRRSGGGQRQAGAVEAGAPGCGGAATARGRGRASNGRAGLRLDGVDHPPPWTSRSPPQSAASGSARPPAPPRAASAIAGRRPPRRGRPVRAVRARPHRAALPSVHNGTSHGSRAIQPGRWAAARRERGASAQPGAFAQVGNGSQPPARRAHARLFGKSWRRGGRELPAPSSPPIISRACFSNAP